MATPKNTLPDPDLERSLWPSARVGEALRVMARAAGLGEGAGDIAVPRAQMDADAFTVWLTAAAEHEGLQAEQQVFSPARVADLLVSAPPLLLRLTASTGEPGFLAVIKSAKRALSVIGPDQRVHRVSVSAVIETFLEPMAGASAASIDRLVGSLEVPDRARARARTAIMAERLAAIRTAGCWLLRVPPGARLRDAASEAGLTRGVLVMLGAHSAQAVLFVVSWWVLGRGLMQGTFDRGWLLGWLLLLLSLVPLRAIASWTQGVMAIAFGAWLRRRLLRGAAQIDRQAVRENGAGRFFSLTVEAGAIESLALNGGVAAALSVIELAVAGAVLGLGAGLLPVVVLLAWLLVAGWFTWRYVEQRRAWTQERLRLTHDLAENMIGHRTRLAQQAADEWHLGEDDAVDSYVARGRNMDEPDLALAALVPRGWLALAIACLTPLALSGATASSLAVCIGGALLAYRAFRRLMAGLSDLAGSLIAGQAVSPLLQAASQKRQKISPATAMAPAQAAGDTSVAAEARQIAFSHRRGATPTLQDCSLRLTRGARVLLEGTSGSGKTTFASILAGLQAPESGLLLVGGLDRSVLGPAGWRARVAMAPQPHDNYLLCGSLAFNLLMGRRWPARESDLEEAETICRELGLGDLLDRMPAGLHQLVGETGWQLSQGERARVFLARALLQRSELLVLDESFGALDPESVDRAVRCVLQRAPTLLAIAHP